MFIIIIIIVTESLQINHSEKKKSTFGNRDWLKNSQPSALNTERFNLNATSVLATILALVLQFIVC